jgi:cytochrome c551/c552
MSSSVKSLAVLALGMVLALPALAQTPPSASRPAAQAKGAAAFPGIGRAATPKEVAAWDIDVRPDFKGLPRGAGSVAKGMDVWENKCASCHGIFGESNEVFSPIVGGTTKADIVTGRVARLTDESFPGRTTMMKLPTLATLWDYINRAMPWTAPKTLTVEEVYAVTAYILHMADVLPENFTLSHENIAQVQQKLPNRNGMTTQHHLWPGRTMGNLRPDVQTVACMANCATEPMVASFLPDFARNAHGNLAEQNRPVGPQRGADTTQAPPRTLQDAVRVTGAAAAAALATPAAASPGAAAMALAQKHSCTACHGMENRIVGPSFKEIAGKHGGQVDYLVGKIRNGSAGVWGAIPMPAQQLPEEDALAMARWLAAGGGR